MSKDLINRILEEIGLESIRGNELEEGMESAEWKRENLQQERGEVS